jgi:hypothetical protein
MYTTVAVAAPSYLVDVPGRCAIPTALVPTHQILRRLVLHRPCTLRTRALSLPLAPSCYSELGVEDAEDAAAPLAGEFRRCGYLIEGPIEEPLNRLYI